jgi:hypothetical protein
MIRQPGDNFRCQIAKHDQQSITFCTFLSKSAPDQTVADVRPRDGVFLTRTCFITQIVRHFSRPIGEISSNTDLFSRQEDDA